MQTNANGLKPLQPGTVSNQTVSNIGSQSLNSAIASGAINFDSFKNIQAHAARQSGPVLAHQ